MTQLVNDKINEIIKNKKEVAKKIPEVREKYISNKKDLHTTPKKK